MYVKEHNNQIGDLSMKVHFKVTKEQAQTISVACEFYSRVIMGQFTEIVWHTLSIKLGTAEFCERRDLAEDYLLKARQYIYPTLHGIGHSFGIGYSEKADMSFDVHQVLRKHLGIEREPFSFRQLPRVEYEGDCFTLKMSEEHLKILSDACWFVYRVCNGHFEDIVEVCCGEKNPKALEFLNLAKEQLITAETNDAADALEIHKIAEAKRKEIK